MPISYFDPLGRAWKRMQVILFGPFDASKYAVIGFSAWLATLFENSSGGGGDWSGDSESWSDWGSGAVDQLQAIGISVLVVLVILAVVVLFFAFLWLSSRFKFVFLDNVIRNEGAVKAPWARYAARGNSLFLWRIGFWIVTLVAAGGVILTGAAVTGVAAGVGLDELSWFAVASFVFVLLFVVILPAAYVGLFLDAFIVPIMVRYDETASEAWRRFLPLLREHLFHFLVYGVFYLVMNILFLALVMLVGFFTCCVGFLLLALPYVGTVLTLPIWVTFRAFSVEFLAQFDPELALFPDATPPPATPQPPPPPPPAA